MTKKVWFKDWVESLDTENRTKIAKDKSKKLVGHLQHVIALHESNKILVYSDVISKQIKRSYAANTFKLLIDSQLKYEILKLTSLWDSPEKNRESIPTVAALIDNDEVRKHLRQEMESHWLNMESRILFTEEQENSEELQQIILEMSRDSNSQFGKQQGEKVLNWLSNSVKISNRVQNHSKFKAMVDFRNQYLAHNLDVTTSIKSNNVRLKHADQKRLMRISIKVIEILYLGVCGVSFDVTGSKHISRKNARLFWEGVNINVLG